MIQIWKDQNEKAALPVDETLHFADQDYYCGYCDVKMRWVTCSTCDGVGSIDGETYCPTCGGNRGWYQCPSCGHVG